MEKKKTKLFCVVYGKHFLEKLKNELNLATNELIFDSTFDEKKFTIELKNFPTKKESFSEGLAR